MKALALSALLFALTALTGCGSGEKPKDQGPLQGGSPVPQAGPTGQPQGGQAADQTAPSGGGGVGFQGAGSGAAGVTPVTGAEGVGGGGSGVGQAAKDAARGATTKIKGTAGGPEEGSGQSGD